MKKIQFLLKSLFLSQLPVMAFAQLNPIPYPNPGVIYTQNFDSLPISISYTLTNKGPFSLQAPPISINAASGWFFVQSAGTASQSGWIAGNGSGTNHGIYSTGATNVKERSLGSLASSGGSYVFGCTLINQTGKTLNQVTITTQIEQWRKGGSGKKNTWYCRAKTGNWQGMDTSNLIACAEGNFSSPISSMGITALNGNLPENQLILNFQLNRFAWKNGEKLMLVWYDPDEAGSDDLCSIDQFQFSANQQISIPKLDSIRIDSLTTSVAVFSCQLSSGGGNTSVEWEWDTIPLFNYPESLTALPANIPDFETTTRIKGRLTNIIPGLQYFVRLVANNEMGSVISEPLLIPIPNLPPRIETYTPTIISSNQIEVNYKIETIGNAPIIASGIQITTRADFSVYTSVTASNTNQGLQKCIIDKLPTGTKIWLRVFAENKEGIFTGNVVNLTTPTTIELFRLASPEITSSNIINYNLQTSHLIQGLTTKSFSVVSEEISDAAVVQISGTQNKYSISVATGNGDGKIQLQLNTLHFTEPTIFPSPVFANGICKIDKTPPFIKKICYANQPYHSHDTVQVYIEIFPEKYNLQLVSGKWAGTNLVQLQKINDSLLLSSLVVPEGKLKIAKEEGIPVLIQVKDTAGNLSAIFQDTIFYSLDEVDTSIPFIVASQQPNESTYAIGDTLEWKLTFSESVYLSNSIRKPYLSINIGSASRQASLGWIKDSILVFRYIVKSGDMDSVGITWKKNIVLNGNTLSDSIGNPALLNFIENKQNKITIDGIAPEITQITLPTKKYYLLSDSLIFVLQFSEKVQLIGDFKNVQLIFSTQTGNIPASLIRMNENQLFFGYKIPTGIWDKKGIVPISVQISKPAYLQDAAGNPANFSLPGPFSNTGIFIDASIPYFLDSSQTSVKYCSSDSTVNLSNQFAWNSPEIGENITINIQYYSGKQKISFSNNAFIANSIIQQPIIQLQITNSSGINVDTLMVSISDSFYTSTKKIILTPIPAIQNNVLLSPPPICSGQALTSISGTVPYGGNGSFTYLWEMAKALNSPYVSFGLPDSISRFSLPNISQPMFLRRKIVSGPCIDYSAGIRIAVKGEGLWTGKKSSDWHDAENWCRAQIPTSEISVLIPGGTLFLPELSKDGYCDSLEILLTGEMQQKGRLQMKGNILAPTGSINASNGTIIFTGIQEQSIYGNQFADHSIGAIQVQNQLGLNILDTLQVNHFITIQKGFIQSNHQLVLKEAAMVGPSAEGSRILGNVQVYKTIQSAKRQYIFNSHPFRNSLPLQVLADQIDITGPASANPPFAASPNNMPSAFRLANAKTEQCDFEQPCWKPFSSLNYQPNEYWKPMEGIRWLFRGKKGFGIDDQTAWIQKPLDSLQQVTLQFVGELNMGDQVLLFSDTTEGYQLIGNPYLCPIDLRKLQFSDSIAPFCWIWNASQGISGGYTCYSLSDAIVIPPFGSFIIKLLGKNAHQIVFSEKSKIYPNNPLAIEDNTAIPELTIQLYQDSCYFDKVQIQNDIKSFSGFDMGDGVKMMNPSHNLYTQTFTKQALSIDKRPINAKAYIPLLIDKITAGNYQLRCNVGGFGKNEKLQLIDFYTLKVYPLVTDTIINIEVNADTLSSSLQRFVIAGIQFSNEPYKPMNLYPLIIWPNPVQNFVNITCKKWPKEPSIIRIVDAMGNLLRIEKHQLAENQILRINTMGFPPGAQLIEISDSNNSFRAIGKWLKQ